MKSLITEHPEPEKNSSQKTDTGQIPSINKGSMNQSAPVKLSRRSFSFGIVGSVALFGLGTIKYLPSKTLNRPPGGQDEERLVSACLHCEKCREVCPKNTISPAHIEDGILNARTPKMNFKQGWCDFCENEEDGPQCVQVCPTGALRPAQDQEIIIGKAVLNRDWCLAVRDMGCRECLDACPYEAMFLGDDQVPVVKEEICNGCGLCEKSCISLSAGSIAVGATDRAITVVPVQERRK